MNTFYWLVKREFWEHRGAFLWTPMIVAGVVLLLNILSIIAAEASGGSHWGIALLWQALSTASPSDLRQMGFILSLSALMPAMIISIVLFFILFSYCMRNLSSDRSDRSILFWKSLPVSDLATVLSKAFSAVIVAPLIAVIVSLISAMLMLVILAISASFHGVSFGEVMWGLPHLGRITFAIGGLFPLYVVWMLPCVGWLMLCSAWSTGKTRRWALALPIAVGAILSWLGYVGPLGKAGTWYWLHIAAHILVGVLPGSWVWTERGTGPELIFHASSDHSPELTGMLSGLGSSGYHLLLTPDFLWGALAGFIMLAIAVWLRRWRTEL